VPKGEYLLGARSIALALEENKRHPHALYILKSAPGTKSANNENDRIQKLAREHKPPVPIYPVEKFVLNQMTHNRPCEGYVLDASHLSFPEITKLVPPSDTTPLWVAIDGVTDSQSLGSLIQSCHFFGVDGIIIPKKYTAPVNALVSKFSNGAVEISPIYSTINLPDILKDNTIQGLSTSGNKKEEKELDDYLLEHQPPAESTWRIIGLELPDLKKTIQQLQ